MIPAVNTQDIFVASSDTVASRISGFESQYQGINLQTVNQPVRSFSSRVFQFCDLRACSDGVLQAAQFRPSVGATLSGIGLMTDMYDLSAMNIAMPLLAKQYGDQTAAQDAMMAGSVMLGAVVGQLAFGAYADKIGRRNLTFIAASLTLLGSLGAALSMPVNKQSPESIYTTIAAMRFLLGIGIGGEYPLSASNTVEHTQTKDSGIALAYIMAILNSGTLLAASVFSILIEVNPKQNDVTWRLGLGFGAVLSAITLGLRACLLEESPAFTQSAFESVPRDSMTLSSRSSTSSTSFRFFRPFRSSIESAEVSMSDVSEALFMIEDIEQNTSQSSSQSLALEETGLLHGINADLPVDHTPLVDRFREVFANPWLKPLVGTASTWFLYDICTFGIGLYSSQILSDKGDVKSAAKSIALSSAFALPFSLLVMVTIHDKLLGRQKSQLIGTLGMATMLGVMAMSKDILWSSTGDGMRFDTDQQRKIFTALYCAFQSFDAVGPGTSVFAYSSEIFPARLRGTLHGVAAAAGKAGAAVGAMSFPYLTKMLGTQGCLLLMSSICVTTALITKWLLPDYTSQHLHAIDELDADASSQEIVDILYSKIDNADVVEQIESNIRNVSV